MWVKKFLMLLAVLITAVPLLAKEQDSAIGNKIMWQLNFPGDVHDVAFMPDENYFIIGHTLHDSNYIEVRRISDESLVRSKFIKEGVIYSLDVSKDGKYVAIGGSSLLKILDIITFEVVKEFSEKSAFSLSISLSPDGKKLAYTDKGKMYVKDVETGKDIFQYGQDSINGQNMVRTKFSPDGKFLVCDYAGGDDKRIFIFDGESFYQYSPFNDDDKTPNAASGYYLMFSPDSKYLLAEGANASVFRIWDINNHKEIFPQNKPAANSVAFFHDSETLFMNSYPDESYIYNIKNNKSVKLNFSPPIYKGIFNKNDSLLLGIEWLCLVQIDKSILSVKDKKNEDDIIAPNPTSGLATIITNLPYNDITSVKLFNEQGNQLQILKKEFVPSGIFEFQFDTNNLPNGMYFIQLTQRDFTKTLKMVKEG